MKRFIFFARLCSWLIFVFPATIAAQQLESYPNYVVIGAFAYQKNAINFTDDARHNKFPARFEMNPNRNLYYVYVLTTHNRDTAVARAVKLRAETKYFDTWVYSGVLGDLVITHATGTVSHDFDPETGEKIEHVHSENTKTISDPADATGGDPARPLPTRVTTEPLKAEEVVGKDFYFHLFRADNGKMVGGEVDAIDFEKAWRMATYQANESVTVRMPAGEAKHVSFLCQVFGYRKLQREFKPDSPAEDFYLDDRGNLVVPFELVRLQKGDIAIMYNVFFFKDAAVMRPESRYEVNNLLELLKENPSYKIMIHGHTNGNGSGKIIRRDEGGDLYSLTGTKKGFGSAKKLSKERAIVIRDFLVNHGIAEDRMEIKAWGGRKPIHDKRSARAHENVRVEIEILSDK